MKPKLLVITPVKHIKGLCDILNEVADVTYHTDPTIDDVLTIIKNYDAIYTNPNKSKVFIGKELMDAGKKLKTICTASTGTNHIDKEYASGKGIKVISLTEERDVINRISSTAEHAFALTMASMRNIVTGYDDVLKGQWNYEKFIGRQMDGLKIGVIGYGRLGKLYGEYCLAFKSKVLVFDPYKEVQNKEIIKIEDINILLEEADVISLHVHVNDETLNMVNQSWFSKMKSEILIVNTSRGEIINESDLVTFLSKNKKARIATDVLSDEIKNRNKNILLKYAFENDQVLITPHIGGMTREAQAIAYKHAAKLLNSYFKSNLKAG
jgi:phosphoglycerate dehydrogenase-like enzyme